MKAALSKHWDILELDPALTKYITPSRTYRRSRSLRDILVKSYHESTALQNVFGSKSPKQGCKRWMHCVKWIGSDAAENETRHD